MRDGPIFFTLATAAGRQDIISRQRHRAGDALVYFTSNLNIPEMWQSISKQWQRLLPIAYRPGQFDARDYCSAFAIALLAGALSLFLSTFLDMRIYDEAGFDVWFQADPPRVFAAMTDALSKWHYRTSVHPLFSIIGTPFVTGLGFLGISPILAGRLLVAISGFVAVGALFLALRGLGIPKRVSCLFAGVLLASATYLNWFCLIETYSLSAASLCLMLLVLTSAQTARHWVWLLASAGTLAVTVTDWALGIFAALFRLGAIRAVLITTGALLLVIVLSIYQKSLYPNTLYFFNPVLLRHEGAYTPLNSAQDFHEWKPWENLRSMLLSSAIAPSPQLVAGDKAGGYAGEKIVTNQHSSAGTYTLADWTAAAAWIILLLCGVDGGRRSAALRPVFLAVTLFLVSQISIYLVYGPITFLYACLFFPALVLLAGFGWFSRIRNVSVYAAMTFVVFGTFGNFQHFKEAISLANMALKP